MTSSLPWLRLYDEVLDDPKVQRLTDAQFRAWINLLCLANRGTIRGRIPENLDDIAYSLRLTPRKTRELLDLFLSRGLLVREENTNHVMPNNWEERQRKSDGSAERVAKHRARQAESNVTEPLLKRNSNVVDIEKSREEKKREEEPPLPPKGNGEGYTQAFEDFWREYPRVVNNSKVKAFRAWRNLSDEGKREARDALPRFKASDGWKRGYAPHTSSYLNGKLWQAEQPDGRPSTATPEPRPPRPPSIDQVLQPRKALSPEKREEILAWRQHRTDSHTSARPEDSTPGPNRHGPETRMQAGS